MSVFLFATAPAAGHTLPALPIARTLIERGHAVRWYTGASFTEAITAIGATYLPMSSYDYSQTGLDGYFPERIRKSGLAKIRFDSVTGFAGAVPHHLRDLTTALEDAPTDLLVGDVALAAGRCCTRSAARHSPASASARWRYPGRTCRHSDLACTQSTMAGGDCATSCSPQSLTG